MQALIVTCTFTIQIPVPTLSKHAVMVARLQQPEGMALGNL